MPPGATSDQITAELSGILDRIPSSSRVDELLSEALPEWEKSYLVQQVKQLFYDARDKRRDIVRQWYSNYSILRNRTWKSSRPDWMPRPEVPEIYPIVTSLVGWYTDTQPQLDVAPAADPFSDYVQFYAQIAADLNMVLDATWQIEDYDAEIEKVVWDAHIYGTGITKSTWDQRLHGGLGNAILRRVDPFTFYPDPNAKSMDDALYFIEVRRMSLQEIEGRWPGSLAKVKHGWTEEADEAPTMYDPHQSRQSTPMANPGAMAPVTVPRYGLPGQDPRIDTTTDAGTTIFEAWLRTPYNPRSNPDYSKDDGYRPDTWRCVVIAGNVVLADYLATDMWSHGQHPYDRFVPHDTGEFWGFSQVELLTPSQISINRLLGAIEHNIWLIGNPVFKEDAGGAVRTRIPNRPGARVQLRKQGGTAEWLAPPQMHPQITADLIRFYIDEMERISGLMAMGRGKSPGGRNAQDVLNSVQEAGFVRVRLGMRNLERTLRRAGFKLASLIAEFYTRPRLVSMLGPSGERTSLALAPKHFYLPTSRGQTPMKFQLLVQAGSALPTSRQARVAEADTLAAMGFLDGEAVLEAHQWPNRQQITQRVRMMQAQQGILGQPPTSRSATGRNTA